MSPLKARLRWAAGSAAALGAGALTAFIAGAAVAGTPTTLSVDSSATVGSSTEAVAVTSGNRAVYTLSGETTHHFLCASSACFSFWPPVKAPSGKLTLAHGISGKLGTVTRTSKGKSFKQLTLSGHPLYRFSQDSSGVAKGNGIMGFGGTWHVIKASGSSSGTSTPSNTTPTMTSTTGTTYTYPPGY
jgi:predicted lipoprotein with Yx(FWY)xxD motif